MSSYIFLYSDMNILQKMCPRSSVCKQVKNSLFRTRTQIFYIANSQGFQLYTESYSKTAPNFNKFHSMETKQESGIHPDLGEEM